MILPNGCYCSEIKVHPDTWERTNASVKKNWYIYFRFHDPKFKDRYPEGYLKMVKRMNKFKLLGERQDATRALINHLTEMLTKFAWNPITGLTEEPIDEDYEIHPESPMRLALEAAAKRLEIAKSTKIQIDSLLKYFLEAAGQLRFDGVAIKDVKRRHIRLILDQCGKNKEVWTANTYNSYRAHLQMIFKELTQLDAIEFNPIRDLAKKRHIQQKKVLLTDEEIMKINTNIRRDNYEFWRVIHMFANSGSRTTEFMGIRYEDVDLNRQMITYTNRKARRIDERPIKNCVKHLWKDMMEQARPKQYLFSEGLLPGDNMIRVDQIKRRWQLWAKEKNGIKADWYALKHLNSDQMEERYGAEVAAQLNKHSPQMVVNHYAVNIGKRRNEVIKRAPNAMALVSVNKDGSISQ